MQVQDMFARLSYRELSSLSIGDEGAGTIPADKQATVVSQINVALTALYTRFPQRRAFLTIQTMPGVQEYSLRPEFAVSDTDPANENPRYIIDTASRPFQGDLIKILSVDRLDDETTTEDESYTFGINQRNSEYGVKILSHDTLRFREPVTGDRFEIEYQANHPKLTIPVDPTESITIMPALEEALQVRVAAGIFQSMTGELHQATGKNHMNHYERLCQMAQNEDMAQEGSSDDFDRLRYKGFV